MITMKCVIAYQYNYMRIQFFLGGDIGTQQCHLKKKKQKSIKIRKCKRNEINFLLFKLCEILRVKQKD